MTHSVFHNDPDLLRRIAEGDEQAFTLLYRGYSASIFSAALRFCRNDLSLAEEIVQIVFIRIWEKREALRTVDQAEDYLFILTRNIIFDYLKKKAHEMALQKGYGSQLSVTVNDTERLLQEEEYDRLLKRAIEQLPPQQRTVYMLAKEEGLSHEQIASRLTLSVYTVQTHLKLAMRAIRKYINAYMADYCLLLLLLEVGLKP